MRLTDIARKLHVSSVTVSRALRGHPDISVETTKKVNKMAREMGYKPARIAGSLSFRRSNIIGVIIPRISNVFFSSVIESINDAAFETDYEIILMVSQENAEREQRHLRSLLSMRVRGLIVSVTEQTTNAAPFEEVRESGIPLTFIDRILDIEGFTKVVVDDHGGAFTATEHAIAIGYKKIGHLGGYQHTSIGRERFRGFADAMKKHGLPVDPRWVIQGGFGEPEGYHGFKKMCESGNRPDFVFAATFPLALGLYRAAEELGLRIPGDVDIIGFGNSGLNQALAPPMSYIEQPTEDLGRKALDLTLEHIRYGSRFVPRLITLPTKLILSRTAV